jgi:hypothetical protein
MFVIKDFKSSDLDEFFDIFKEIGIVEIQADWAAQNNFEEFNSFCWNSDNEDIEIHDALVSNQKHIETISLHNGLPFYLEKFLKSCIPINYKDDFGSFGFIKFKIEERDYEIIKFEYSKNLD